jgi:hypothetical protein
MYSIEWIGSNRQRIYHAQHKKIMLKHKKIIKNIDKDYKKVYNIIMKKLRNRGTKHGV